ncbi:prepilin-type cleavage/methylation domain-containing protein [Photobacterium sanctipauli]|uniref:Prepilin-type cleavage/methylation domain-containing protein n=1 Tax=Photobacterium sanctipauli TaxID=1342794 RepID=A0A2T3N9M7_9GAMM|nr:type II secretion system protein [Photobacterium sanctipauli]PSW10217.1 prepilin-type cleavage/methylation domain-containing protein [Photobacterium sanctipauli]
MEKLNSQQGFTLMEMVIALVILGIISLAVGSYLQLGAQGYLGVVNRDRTQLIARFALEKMTREIRHAAPNSVSVDSSGRCLSFYPVKLAGFYLHQPVGAAIDFSSTLGSDSDWKAITTNYWLAVGFSSSEQYDTKTNAITVVVDGPDAGVLTAQLSADLASSSPASRLYAYSEKVQYCFDSTLGSLHRLTNNASVSNNNLIAQQVSEVYFNTEGLGMNSNGMVHIRLTLQREQSTETATYEHSVQVINVL